LDDELKTKTDKARERFQTERIAIRKTLMDEERNKRTEEVRKAEQEFWLSLGEEEQEQVRERMNELQPIILPTHPRQLGSTAPVEVEGSVMDEYYFLRRLSEGE
jgi:hypothetical protein